MGPEQLPENKGGRPPPENTAISEPSTDLPLNPVEPQNPLAPSDIGSPTENRATMATEGFDSDERARLAIEHFEQWLRSRHPELSDAEIQKNVEQVTNSKTDLEYFIYRDGLDERMLVRDPEYDVPIKSDQ